MGKDQKKVPPVSSSFRLDKAKPTANISQNLTKIITAVHGGLRFKTESKEEAIAMYCKEFDITKERLDEIGFRVEYLKPLPGKPSPIIKEIKKEAE